MKVKRGRQIGEYTMSIKILLADDHRIMREGLRSLIENEPDMEVVAEAADGRATVRLAEEVSPDVAVVDITMPELNGIEASSQIVSRAPDTKVLALSIVTDLCPADNLQPANIKEIIETAEGTEPVLRELVDEYLRRL